MGLCGAGAGVAATLGAVVWTVLAANADQARRREQSWDDLGAPLRPATG